MDLHLGRNNFGSAANTGNVMSEKEALELLQVEAHGVRSRKDSGAELDDDALGL